MTLVSKFLVSEVLKSPILTFGVKITFDTLRGKAAVPSSVQVPVKKASFMTV